MRSGRLFVQKKGRLETLLDGGPDFSLAVGVQEIPNRIGSKCKNSMKSTTQKSPSQYLRILGINRLDFVHV